MNDYPQFPGAGAKIHVCDPGTREINVPQRTGQKKNGGHTDRVLLTPHMRGDALVYAGYHARSETWYYSED